jgi:hypothetical protein
VTTLPAHPLHNSPSPLPVTREVPAAVRAPGAMTASGCSSEQRLSLAIFVPTPPSLIR